MKMPSQLGEYQLAFTIPVAIHATQGRIAMMHWGRNALTGF